MGTPLYQRRAPQAGHIELVPNPHFVFPQPSPDSPPSDEPRASVRRPSSLQVLPTARRTNPDISKRRSASALPDFSFNPGTPALTPAPSTTTPPLTPTSNSPTTPSRNLGHRRGASEFIGGGTKRVGTMVPMSTSPTKIEGGFSLPNSTLKPGPPAGRRGHAHRRSGAISSHDLSFMLQPPSTNTTNTPNVPDIPRIDNTPATPVDRELKPSPFPKSTTPPPVISVSDSSENLNSSQADSDSSPQRPSSRARVGFSETVEYIRPLSTISSETESTMSTIRGHSVSNSLSSVVSGASSPSAARVGRWPLTVAFDKEPKTGRPSTAGAILDSKDTSKMGFGELLASKRPRSAIFPELQPSPSASSPPARHNKKRSFFWSEQRNSDSSISAASGITTSEASVSVLSESPMSSPADPCPADFQAKVAAPPTPPRKSHSKKPRKVKSWATSIISRKTKRHNSKLKEIPRRGSTPTLPSQSSVPDDDIEVDLDDISPNFDVDDTVTIVTPTSNPLLSRPKLDTNIASWKPKQLQSQEHDAMSPVIDLDAALGPFNTPTIGPVPSRAQARGGVAARRRPMHSSMGVMSGHRRTESAPELVPFEFRSTPAATGPTMADVFEEEEEEDEHAATSASGNSSSVAEASASEDEDETGTGIQVVETDQPQDGTTMNWNFNNDSFSKSKSSLELLSPSPTAARTTAPVSPGTRPVHISRAPSPIDIVEEHEEPRTSTVTRSSDSTITAAADASKEAEQPLHLPVPAPCQASLTPDSFSTSSFSSPDLGRGQNSFDTPRIGTAASSITDSRSMQMGEPGPDCRVSVDDVPSLTSSRSTMTSAQQANFPYVMPRSPGDRMGSISSMSSMPYETRRKRASIASLSRLVGSSFGEKSKLSIEQRPQSEHADKPKDSKHKKSRRLSKMMQFWKNKQNLRS
ncbi:hypothetical protein SLS56_007003 [Neofusicoccum ribis]|uniref:Cell wall proline rich protein n=1 Tax=Neofusicoccum ribis TaxID=45134 RepID=A0ABR3SP58_9PEZI